MSGHYDDALHMMEKQGGSFVRALANAYYAADSANKKILREAFSEYFDKYQRRFDKHQTSQSSGSMYACDAALFGGDCPKNGTPT